jgi:hypothetical protein
MTGRILRIELRRSSAISAAIIVCGLGFGLTFLLTAAFGSNPWWFSLVVNHRAFFAIVAPLALGAGAQIGRRDRRGRIEELLATTPRRTSSRLWPVAVALAITLAAGYVAALVLNAATGLRPLDAYFPLGALPVVANGVLALVAVGWLGLAIGRMLPSSFTPPLLTVVGFVAMVVLPQSFAAAAETREGIYLLIPEMQNPVNLPVAFTTVSPRVNLLQALWFTAAASTALALFVAARRQARVAALAPAVLAAAVAVPLLPDLAGDMYVRDRAVNAPACTADAPTVCINRLDQHTLSDWVGPGRQALAILAEKLPPAPTRVEVYMWIAPDATAVPGNCPAGAACSQPVRSADTLTIELGHRGYNEARPVPAGHHLWYLLSGAGAGRCGAQLTTDDDRLLVGYLAARLAAASWLIGEAPPPDFETPGDGPDPVQRLAAEILGALEQAPAEEQRERVAALREAERTCMAGDRTAILTGNRP